MTGYQEVMAGVPLYLINETLATSNLRCIYRIGKDNMTGTGSNKVSEAK